MPGIITGHTRSFYGTIHVGQGGVSKRACVVDLPEDMDNMKKALRSGVTFVRDLGCFSGLDVEFRGYVEAGRAEGRE